jgi:hypothetical protein
VPALSIQSLPPASVADIPGHVPAATDAASDARFAAIRSVTRMQTSAFEKELKGSRNIELVGADHYNFVSNPDDVRREIHTFLSDLR